MKSYRIEFIRRRSAYEKANNLNGFIDEENRYDETELDAENEEELMDLFADFIDENQYKDVSVTDVTKVPYDGEEE